MLTIDEALKKVLGLVEEPLGGEWLTLEQACGRVLAQDINSTRALPPFDNSAMDGYALRFDDARPEARLRVIEEIPAGSLAEQELGAGEAMRIFTGASIPRGCELVVMQEHVSKDGDTLVLSGLQGDVELGQHIRRRGSDVKEGDCLLRAGSVIGPGEVGLLAACGRSGVLVRRKPRVAIISTGHELRYVDEEPGPGQIVNSNSLALMALVREAGGEPCHFPIVPDTREAHHAAFKAAESFDVILTSGGVSVGDHDLIQPVLEERGWQRCFWKVALKPGKPVLCGTLKSGTIFLGLPGNPASTMVTFELFGRPLLRTLQGHPRPYRGSRRVPLSVDYNKRAGRTHVIRGAYRESGFEPLSQQGSGLLRSMVGVEAFAFLPSEQEHIAKGTEVLTLDLRHDGMGELTIPT